MSRDPRPVVWLAGFPSSGNIKIQLGLANLLFGRVTSIGDLDTKIPPMGIAHALPSSPTARDRNYVFTHHLATEPLLALGRTEKIIYVVRDPVDVGISSAGYMLPRMVDFASADDQALEAARRALIAFFLQWGTFEPYLAQGYGAWSMHVLSWIAAARRLRVPFQLIRFDDTRNQPEAVLTTLSRFLGVAASTEQIADAIDNWSMPVSKSFEEVAIASKTRSRFYKPQWQSAYDRGWRYHGAGGSRYGRGLLDEDQWRMARTIFGPAARAVAMEIGP